MSKKSRSVDMGFSEADHLAHELIDARLRIEEMEMLLKAILPDAMWSSCEYSDNPFADPTSHCCDWNEIVVRIKSILRESNHDANV